MIYHYVASRANGQLIEGDHEARDVNDLLVFLTRNQLKPISVTKVIAASGLKRDLFVSRVISMQDKIFLAKHLALMLKLGTDLFRALDILIEDTGRPAMKLFLKEVRANLEKGQPFYVSFEKDKKNFSNVFTNLVRAGEESGNLEKTFDNIALMLTRQEDLRRKILSALIYPALLMFGSVFILIFLTTFALPKIAVAFSSGGFTIPLFSRIVFGVGLFVSKYVFIIFPLLFIGFFGGIYYFWMTASGRKMFFRILNRIPVINDVVKKVAIQRMALTLGTLLKAGVTITKSLQITADSSGNEEMKAALIRISSEGIEKGVTIGDAFKREKYLPVTVSSLISISEKAGHLDEVLFTLSNFYDGEIEFALKTVVSLIEPAMLVFIGGIVLVIALSIIVPIYQLVASI